MRPAILLMLIESSGVGKDADIIDVGGKVQRPLATVIIGGIFTNTRLTLLVLPALYSLSKGKQPR